MVEQLGICSQETYLIDDTIKKIFYLCRRKYRDFGKIKEVAKNLKILILLCHKIKI